MRLIFLIFALILSATGLFFAFKSQIKEIGRTVRQPTTASASAATATSSPTPKPIVKLPLNVPFTVQAPFAQWSDPRQQDVCEEASVLMAMKWVRGEKIASKGAALVEILDMSYWQEKNFGNYHDTSAQDTVKRLINGYYQYTNAEVKTITNPADIINELEKGNLVITPMNGQALNNPHFTQPGPQRHMIVVKGFDKTTNEFITNDPGIREGENYRYPEDLFFAAIRDYPTGDHVPITTVEKRMIIVSR